MTAALYIATGYHTQSPDAQRAVFERALGERQHSNERIAVRHRPKRQQVNTRMGALSSALHVCRGKGNCLLCGRLLRPPVERVNTFTALPVEMSADTCSKISRSTISSDATSANTWSLPLPWLGSSPA